MSTSEEPCSKSSPRDPSPASKPARHKPSFSSCEQEDVLHPVASAPPLEMVNRQLSNRRAARGEVAKHERGLKPRHSASYFGTPRSPPYQSVSRKVSSVLNEDEDQYDLRQASHLDGEDDGEHFVDEEDDLLTLQLSEDHHPPSQEVSVLSWTLSATEDNDSASELNLEQRTSQRPTKVDDFSNCAFNPWPCTSAWRDAPEPPHPPHAREVIEVSQSDALPRSSPRWTPTERIFSSSVDEKENEDINCEKDIEHYRKESTLGGDDLSTERPRSRESNTVGPASFSTTGEDPQQFSTKSTSLVNDTNILPWLASPSDTLKLHPQKRKRSDLLSSSPSELFSIFPFTRDANVESLPSADVYAWLQICLNYQSADQMDDSGTAVADEAPESIRCFPLIDERRRSTAKDRELEDASVETVSTHLDGTHSEEGTEKHTTAVNTSAIEQKILTVQHVLTADVATPKRQFRSDEGRSSGKTKSNSPVHSEDFATDSEDTRLRKFSLNLFSKPTSHRSARSRASSKSKRHNFTDGSLTTHQQSRNLTSEGIAKNRHSTSSVDFSPTSAAGCAESGGKHHDLTVDRSAAASLSINTADASLKSSTKELVYELLRRLQSQGEETHPERDFDLDEDYVSSRRPLKTFNEPSETTTDQETSVNPFCHNSRHCFPRAPLLLTTVRQQPFECNCSANGRPISHACVDDVFVNQYGSEMIPRNSEQLEALTRGILREADSQVAAALEERDLAVREMESEHQRFLRASQRLESALQERKIELARIQAEFGEERRRLRSKCQELEETLEKWERSFDRLKAHAADRESQMINETNRLRDYLSARESELQNIANEVTSKAQEIQSLQRSLVEIRDNWEKEMSQAAKSHEEASRTLRKKHEEELAVLDKHWTAVVANLNQLLSDSRADEQKKSQDIEVLRSDLQKQQKKSTELEDTLKSERTKSEEAGKERDEEIHRLKNDCEELASSLHRIKKSYDNLRKRHVPMDEFESLKERLADIEESSNELKEVIESLQGEKNDLQNQVARLTSRCAGLEKGLTEKEVALTIKSKMMEEQALYVSKLREKYQSVEREALEAKAFVKKREEQLLKSFEEEKQQKAAAAPFEQNRRLFELQSQNDHLRHDLQEKIACLDLVAKEIEDLRSQRQLEREKDEKVIVELKKTFEEETAKRVKDKEEATKRIQEVERSLTEKEHEIDLLTVELEQVKSAAAERLTQIAIELTAGNRKDTTSSN